MSIPFETLYQLLFIHRLVLKQQVLAILPEISEKIFNSFISIINHSTINPGILYVGLSDANHNKKGLGNGRSK